MRLVTIRPEPGASLTVQAGSDSGLEVEAFPLFEVAPLDWSLPEGSFDGLLAGSANAMRLGGPHLASLTGTPVYAVGEITAAAAWERGFTTAAIGGGGLQFVLDDLTGQRLRLLRIAGEAHVPLTPPAGIEIVTVVAYRAEPKPLPDGLAGLLAARALVLLHSAEAARHFASEVDRLGLSPGNIALAALAPRIAEAAGPGWAAVRAARQPNDPALLALAREMCHEPFPGRDGRQ
jgi:uroporphyrinogen-III synthase